MSANALWKWPAGRKQTGGYRGCKPVDQTHSWPGRHAAGVGVTFCVRRFTAQGHVLCMLAVVYPPAAGLAVLEPRLVAPALQIIQKYWAAALAKVPGRQQARGGQAQLAAGHSGGVLIKAIVAHLKRDGLPCVGARSTCLFLQQLFIAHNGIAGRDCCTCRAPLVVVENFQPPSPAGSQRVAIHQPELHCRFQGERRKESNT